MSEHLREGRELQGRGDPDAATIRSEASLQRARSRKLDAARLASGMLPEDFDAMLRSFQASRTVLTAVELDVFTAVGRGATAAEVADRTGTSLVGMSPLLHALVALGLLRKDAGRFHCGPLADSLLRADAAHDARAVLLHVEHTWHYWSTLTECVRRGTAVRDARIEERGPAWTRAFIAAMHHAASARTPVVLAALDLGGVRRILDLGGGSGAFSIAFARAVPDALVTLLDTVHGHASRRTYADASGVGDRIRTVDGDIDQPSYGEGYDLVFASAVCHLLSPEDNLEMLRKCHAALRPGGRVVIQEFVLDDDKTGPRHSALFALNMLVWTRGGSTYSGAEYHDWLRRSGFVEAKTMRLPGPADLIVGRRPG